MNARCIMAFVYYFPDNMEPVYLLLKRTPQLGGYWQPVTGFMEQNESAVQAALREIEEETGLKSPRQIMDIDFRFSFFMEEDGIRCYVDTLGVEVEHSQIELSFEHTDYRWLGYQKARELLYWDNNKKTLDLLHDQLQIATEKHK